ncbi:MAG: heavy metal-binding domain-containing protein [Planctomycetota bacterium]|jgi:YHS domain-containing protein
MNVRSTKIGTMLLVTGVLLIGLFMLNSCKKSEPAPSETSAEKMQEMGEQKWTCSMHPEIISDKPGKCSTCGMDLVLQKAEQKRGAMTMPMPAKEIASAVEQTTCPIMGSAIDKALFTEYKGKKVYFCCPGCKPEFEKNPEKYIAKLPQFKQ